MLLFADRIIAGRSGIVNENHALRIVDGKITEILPAGEAKANYPSEAAESFPGCSILPGYVDLHVHLGNWGKRPLIFEENPYLHAFMTLHNAGQVFQYGVTTVRDVSSADGLAAALCYAKSAGLLPQAVPRIIPSGNGLCMTGGHGSEIPHGGDVADGPWELRKAVRRKLAMGNRWIKILTSRRKFLPEYSQEELDAAADECHRLGGKIAAHSGVPVTIQMCIDAGFDTIEHGTFLSREQALQMKEKGIAWIPTITPYTRAYLKMERECKQRDLSLTEQENFRFFESAANAYRENFKLLYGTGVTVGAGTDLALDEGEGTPVAEELAYMAGYGISPLQAIEAGTGTGAEILGLSNVTGGIAPGLSADLQIVRGNPCEDIGALQSIVRVYFKGERVYSS